MLETKTVTIKLTKKAAVKLSDHTPITYCIYGVHHWQIRACSWHRAR